MATPAPFSATAEPNASSGLLSTPQNVRFPASTLARVGVVPAGNRINSAEPDRRPLGPLVRMAPTSTSPLCPSAESALPNSAPPPIIDRLSVGPSVRDGQGDVVMPLRCSIRYTAPILFIPSATAARGDPTKSWLMPPGISYAATALPKLSPVVPSAGLSFSLCVSDDVSKVNTVPDRGPLPRPAHGERAYGAPMRITWSVTARDAPNQRQVGPSTDDGTSLAI